MDFIESHIHHMSSNQLRALFLLAKTKDGVIDSIYVGKKINKLGKALGGVFSSLFRHKIRGENLIIPWGKSKSGRGLRWKLNTKIISQERLKKIVSKLLI